MSHGHARSITARASQIRCDPIKPQLLRTESLVIGAINGLLLLIISVGLIVSGVAYAVAISSVARDVFVGQSESAGVCRRPGCALGSEGSGC
jgi:hypothetical protein